MFFFTFKPGNIELYHQNINSASIFKQITHNFNDKVYRDLYEAHII